MVIGEGSQQEHPDAGRSGAKPTLVWPGWVRVLVAVGVVVVFFHFYAGWHWWEEVHAGRGVTFSPTRAYVGRQSTMSLIVQGLVDGVRACLGRRNWLADIAAWRLCYTAATILPAAVLGVVAYEVLTRRFGKMELTAVHSRCRRCGHILKGLTQPRCPECGESI